MKFPLVLCWILVFFIVSTASALSVLSETVSPSSNIPEGSGVSASFVVYATNTSLSNAEEVQFLTDLDNPNWIYQINVNGVQYPQPPESRKAFYLRGFPLPSPRDFVPTVFIEANLSGTAPTTPRKVTVFKVTVFDLSGRPVPGYSEERTALVVEPTQIATPTPIPTTILLAPSATSARPAPLPGTIPVIFTPPSTNTGIFDSILRALRELFGIHS